MRTVVIGAGLGGLSAACHLRADGHEVTVVEASAHPGGCMGSADHEGYRFDTGPTVFTMPQLLDDCFAAVGAARADHVELRPIDPLYRTQFADGSELRVRRGRDAMTEEIATVCGPQDAAAFGRFVDWLQRLHDVEMPHFIDRNYDGALDLVRPLGPALQLVRLGAFRKLASVVRRRFGDERLQRIFSFQALYAGLAPHDALAIYAVITYMDTVGGVYAPVGGMGAVPRALASAAADAGVEFLHGTAVDRIERDAATGAVRGVCLADGTPIPADSVVANADTASVYRNLLDGVRPPRVVRRGRYAPSAVVWHVGTRGRLPAGAAHHNVHFGDAWRSSFTALIRDGRRMPDPSILVSIASIDDPAAAPAGGHSLYVLEPAPNLDGVVDWAHERHRVRHDLATQLGRLGYGVEPADIDVEQLVDPLDWRAAGLERGTPFSLAHRFGQTGPFRTPNVERRVPGLVLCGAGTVPGVGIPMVLVSGRLAADRVRRLERSGMGR